MTMELYIFPVNFVLVSRVLATMPFVDAHKDPTGRKALPRTPNSSYERIVISICFIKRCSSNFFFRVEPVSGDVANGGNQLQPNRTRATI